MGVNRVVENQTLSVYIFACGTKKVWTSSLLQQNSLGCNKSPPAAPHPAPLTGGRNTKMASRRKVQRGG